MQEFKKTSGLFIISFCIYAMINCSSSPLGPEISIPEGSTGGSSSTTDGTQTQTQTAQQPGTTQGSQTQQGSGTTAAATSIACSRTSGHSIYYLGTTVSLEYTCDATVTSTTETGMPSFLTTTIADTKVTFSGTVSGSGTTSWSFTVNGETTTGDSSAITTTVLATSGLTGALSGTFNLSSNYDTAISVDLDGSIDSSWDGDTSTVSLTAVSLDTDMHGLTVFSDCTSPTPPYVCHDTQSISGFNFNRGLNIRWKFSAFDQGNYNIAVNPRVTIDGGNIDLSVTSSSTFTIPIQTNGNVELVHSLDLEDSGGFNDRAYRSGVAISGISTATTPIVGMVFPVKNGNQRAAVKRVSIDRTDDPSGGSNGVTQSGEVEVTDTLEAQEMAITSLADGNWITVGRQVTGGIYDLYFNKVTDSATLPGPAPTGVTLTSLGAGNIGAVSITKPFLDSDSTTRIGVAFVRNNTNDFLTISKINPAGTTKNTIIDDTNYDSEANGGTNMFELDGGGAGAVDFDRVTIRYKKEGSTGYFYTAYRSDQDIKVTKILSTYSAGYSPTTATLATTVLSDSGTSPADSVHMAVGEKSGSNVIGVVYQKSGGHCFFKRFNQDLSTASQELDISDDRCHFPTIHFNSKSGRFLVTMSEKNVNNALGKYEIVATEITLNSSESGLDTKSTNTVIRDVLAGDPTVRQTKLVTDFYEDGNWMAVFYRVWATDDMYIHGYHVSDQ